MRFKMIPVFFLAAACLFPLKGHAQSDPADYTNFLFEPVKGKNAVVISTYSSWHGPEQRWPIATDSGDLWEATVHVYSKNGKRLGEIAVPESVKGRTDYGPYLEQGLDYIIVTQATGAVSKKYYPLGSSPGGGKADGVKSAGPDKKPAKSAPPKAAGTTKKDAAKKAHDGVSPVESTPEETAPVSDLKENTNKMGNVTKKEQIKSAHIVFTKVDGEKWMIRARIDNGQYGEDWWGIWDISTEGDWASKVYILDSKRKVLGRLSVPESALGVLDYSSYKTIAAYIQVEHSTCVGIYEIATGKTITGTLDDIISEEPLEVNNNTKYRTVIAAILAAALTGVILFLYLRKKRSLKMNR